MQFSSLQAARSQDTLLVTPVSTLEILNIAQDYFASEKERFVCHKRCSVTPTVHPPVTNSTCFDQGGPLEFEVHTWNLVKLNPN